MADFRSADAQLTTSDTVALTFAEAMIGNFDWCLRFTPGDRYRCDASKPLWNILAFEREDARALPVMHDFDLSGMVTGRHNWFDRVLNQRFSGSGSQTEVEVVSQLQHTRSVFSRRDLDLARQRIIRHKDAAFAALDDANLDGHGRESSPDISPRSSTRSAPTRPFIGRRLSRRRLRMPIRKGTPRRVRTRRSRRSGPSSVRRSRRAATGCRWNCSTHSGTGRGGARARRSETGRCGSTRAPSARTIRRVRAVSISV